MGHSPGSSVGFGRTAFWDFPVGPLAPCPGEGPSALPGYRSLPRRRGSETDKPYWNPQQAARSGRGPSLAISWVTRGSGAIQTGEETPSAPGGRQPQADTRRLCSHHMAPSASAHWHAQPLPRLLAPGVLAASWPTAPFPPEWSREGGKRWGPASAGAHASLGHEVGGRPRVPALPGPLP